MIPVPIFPVLVAVAANGLPTTPATAMTLESLLVNAVVTVAGSGSGAGLPPASFTSMVRESVSNSGQLKFAIASVLSG